MSDIFTVLQKELRELVGERVSRRGGFIQSLVVIVMLGIVFPAGQGVLWLAGSPLAIIYFTSLPAILAVTVAADAFAGERERKTLETLLATPLSERSILVGKGAAAIAFALFAAVVALLAAVITVNVTAHPASLFLPSPLLLAGALGGAFASASLTSAVAILVSMRVPVARSVQQMTSLSGMLLFSAIAATWSALGLAMTWANVLAAEGAVLLVALALFELARATFRRDRFFERR
jgi:ABC-2 type transport system permease protein